MYKKIPIISISFLMVFGVFFVTPKKASAVFPVIDVVNIGVNTENAAVNTENAGVNTANTVNSTWQFLKDNVVVPALKFGANRLLRKISQDTTNWANGGFDGEPGFINNWDDFLKGTQYDVINGAFQKASIVAQDLIDQNNTQNQTSLDECLNQNETVNNYQVASCNSEYLSDYQSCIKDETDEDFLDLCEQNLEDSEFTYNLCLGLNGDQNEAYQAGIQSCYDQNGNILGEIAQQNYNTWQSGNFINAKSAATTIIDYGVKKFNINKLDSIIKGEGNELKQYLGTQKNVDDFSKDILVGGWTAYLTLANPESYPIGIDSTLRKTLEKETTGSTDSKVKEIQTPKFLNKVDCLEYAKNADGTNGACLKKITKTPGEVVSNKVTKALNFSENSLASVTDLDGAITAIASSVIDGLISKGVNDLSQAASKAFFGQDKQDAFIGTDEYGKYQSEYSVLGIGFDLPVGITGNGNTSGFDEDSSGNGGLGGGTVGTQGGEIIIDGPEDSNEGTQITINLQELLEKNIDASELEKSYYDGIEDLLVNSAELFLEFDKCVPGPDYNWERRYLDVLPINGADDESQNNSIGLNETKKMVKDSRVNIPGAIKTSDSIKNTIETTKDSITENNYRSGVIKDNLLTLNYIKDSVLRDFNNQKQSISNDLVLFESDWNNLSQTRKENLLKIAIEKGYYLGAGYTNTDGTINTQLAIVNDESKAKLAILSIGWDLWRTNTNVETKTSLREQIYTIRNSLSLDKLVTNAKIKYTRAEQNLDSTYKIGLDCLSLKAYSLGTPRTQIANITNGGQKTSLKASYVANIVNTREPNANNLSSEGFDFYDVSSAKSDLEIKSFLESEYAMQNDGNPITTSVFNGFTVTSPTNISNSILGFQSETEKQNYFNSNYSDIEFPFPENMNKLSISEMYKVDRVFAKTKNITPAGVRGHLFCRNTGVFKISNNSGTNCWKDFYNISKLDYTLIVSGV